MNPLVTRWGQSPTVCTAFNDINNNSSQFASRTALSLSGFAFVSSGKETDLLYIIE
jgi:hypothetical protein